MKIAYTTTYDADNIHNWSGLGYYIAQALKLHHELDYIGNLTFKPTKTQKFKRKIYNYLGKEFDYSRETNIARQYALQIEQKLKMDHDVVFSPGTLPIAHLRTQKPISFYTDATFAGMLGYYKEFSQFSVETIRHGNSLEQKALDNCDVAIYASHWAAKTALENYRVDASKIKVVPFGANVSIELDYSSLSGIIEQKSDVICNLLFIGVDWVRKGGDKAVEIAKQMNKRGICTNLHVVGIPKIPIDDIPAFVINHGFISKSTEAGVYKLKNLFEICHFLVVPTMAEAYGLVFCEANANGIPALSHITGGVSTIIENDINGKLFSFEDDVNDWVNYLCSVFINKSFYSQMCFQSLNKYQSIFNWSTAGESISSILKAL